MIKRMKFLTIAFLTFWLLVTICHFLFKPIQEGELLSIDTGWTIEFNDDIYENVRLSDIPGKIAFKPKKGDVFSMSTTIPKSST